MKNNFTSNYRQLLWSSWCGALAFLGFGIALISAIASEKELSVEMALPVIFAIVLTAVGLGILKTAIKRTRTHFTVGTMALQLDPFPGSIGGDVGGRIFSHLPIERLNKGPIWVTLKCTEYYPSPKSRERHSRIMWQREGLAQAHDIDNQCELRFRFELPQGLHPTSPESDRYHRWFITLHSDLPGAAINRQYEIPVVESGECSSESLWDVDWREHPQAEKIHLDSVESLLNIEQRSDGISLHIGAGQAAGLKLSFMLVGIIVAVVCGYSAIFTVAGWIVGGPLLIGCFFGSVIALACLFQLLRSLKVDVSHDKIACNTYLLGISVWRQCAASDQIESLYIQRTSSDNFSGRTTEYFEMRAQLKDTNNNDILLAVGIKNKDSALAVLEAIAILGGYQFQSQAKEFGHKKINRADKNINYKDR